MLILVRHGQTEANASGQYLGRADPPLTELGQVQAAALGPALAGGVRRIISSPLQRATQTAEQMGLGLPIEIDEAWVEMDYGSLDGAGLASLEAGVAKKWREDVEYAPGGGESLAQVGGRIRQACTDLSAEAAAHDIVVVSHVSPIKAAVAWALGCNDAVAWRMFLGLASVTRIATGGESPSLHGYNDLSHLAR